ncbi:MAG: hypothetical protein LUF82_04890 [Clostridia bacterium]|nr:hypothetical protein [Clostridia bacterium]
MAEEFKPEDESKQEQSAPEEETVATVKTKKKLPKIAIYSITFGAIVIVLLVLAISSAVYSVSRTKSAIDDIWADGDITYTTETREKIETAISYYDALDTNISLDERITNADLLTEARAEYTRLSIVQLYKAEKSGEDEEVILAYIEEAREVYDSIIGDSGIVVENYSDLTDAEEQYGVGTSSEEDDDDDGGSDEDEEIEIC